MSCCRVVVIWLLSSLWLLHSSTAVSVLLMQGPYHRCNVSFSAHVYIHKSRLATGCTHARTRRVFLLSYIKVFSRVCQFFMRSCVCWGNGPEESVLFRAFSRRRLFTRVSKVAVIPHRKEKRCATICALLCSPLHLTAPNLSVLLLF